MADKKIVLYASDTDKITCTSRRTNFISLRIRTAAGDGNKRHTLSRSRPIYNNVSIR